MQNIKTQTIRIIPEIHRLAKTAAAEKGMYLQSWIEQLILKEVEKDKALNP